jgi:hypothetical protein
MPNVIPKTRPRLTGAELEERLAPFAIDREKHPLIVVGIRGYYKDSMGAPHVNDRKLYDDAIFVHSPSVFAAYNGNTDPDFVRKGIGTADKTKGMASLNPGAWFVHRFDNHHGKYLALCQRAGEVEVTRDGINGPYLDRGAGFGINIHRGGNTRPGSEGCQTLHPSQWDSFINLVVDQAKRYFGTKWKSTTIPYVLLVE